MKFTRSDEERPNKKYGVHFWLFTCRGSGGGAAAAVAVAAERATFSPILIICIYFKDNRYIGQVCALVCLHSIAQHYRS